MTQKAEKKYMKEQIAKISVDGKIYDPTYGQYFTVDDAMKSIDLLYEVAPSKKATMMDMEDIEEIIKWSARTIEKMLEAGIIDDDTEDTAIYSLAKTAVKTESTTDVYMYAEEYSKHLVIFRDKPRKKISPQFVAVMEHAPVISKEKLETMCN